MGETVELGIKITGDTAEAKQAIEAINNALNGTKEKSGEADKSSASLMGTITESLAVYELAKNGIEKVVEALKDSVLAAAENEASAAKLAQAMRTLGDESYAGLQANLDFAKSMSLVSEYSSGEVEALETLLTRFGIHGDALREVTKATIDFAAATGRDLNSAGELVSRTYLGTGDSLGKYRIGIEGASESSERLRSITDRMTAVFGGAASASLLTFAGQMKQASKNSEELRATFGAPLMDAIRPSIEQFNKMAQAPETIGAVQRAGMGLVLGFDIVKILIQHITLTFRVLGEVGLAVFQSVSEVVQNAIKTVQNFGEVLKNPWKALSDTKDAAINIVDKFAKKMESSGKDILKTEKELWEQAGKDFVKFIDLKTKYENDFNKNHKDGVDKSGKIDAAFRAASVKAEQETSDAIKKIKLESWQATSNAFAAFTSTLIDSNFSWKKASIYAAAAVLESIGDMIAQALGAVAAQYTVKGFAALASVIESPAAPGYFAAAGVAAAGAGTAKGLSMAGAAAIRSANVNAMAEGGIINEPVMGIGGVTGQRYLFGEAGPERVSPMGSMQGGGTIQIGQIIINGASDGKKAAREVLEEMERLTGTRILRR